MKRRAPTELRTLLLSVGALLYLTGACGVSHAYASDAPLDNTFITLGTAGGPIPNPGRSQPANALIVDGRVYLIDVGDGTAEQLAKAGIPLGSVAAVFISHLHFDHTGGLSALIGLRYQASEPGTLTIYGPPGVKTLVNGIIASMQPAAEAGFGMPGAPVIDPATTVNVIEIRDGANLPLADFTFSACENTHYSFPKGGDLDQKFDSLSFRFDLADRSIVYTGDTGPSAALEKLAKGADLLVSEMIDLKKAVERLKRARPGVPPAVFEGVVAHLEAHHLTPEQVALIAAKAKVGELVLTHGAGDDTPTGGSEKSYRQTIAEHFQGAVFFAKDLDRF